MPKVYDKLNIKLQAQENPQLMSTSLGKDGSSERWEDEENPLRSIVGDGIASRPIRQNPDTSLFQKSCMPTALIEDADSTIHHNLYCTS